MVSISFVSSPTTPLNAWLTSLCYKGRGSDEKLVVIVSLRGRGMKVNLLMLYHFFHLVMDKSSYEPVPNVKSTPVLQANLTRREL